MTSENARLFIPSGQTLTVKLINTVNFGPAILDRFMTPAVPGLETFKDCPSFSFLLEHPSGRRLVWDLGIRKDFGNGYASSIRDYLPTTNYTIDTTFDVVDVLQRHGIEAVDIEAVIWSHWHWDHIGDPSRFPSSTKLIVGPGFQSAMLPGAPANPQSPILESDYVGRELQEISFGESTLRIGQFPASDYFGDGSFYLLDSPGHAVGHLCGLVRTTSSPDSFVLLGGDVCHYAGILRPSPRLPMPKEIMPHPCRDDLTSLCPGAAWEHLQSSRGRKVNDTLYDMSFGQDIPLATKTVGRLQELDCDERIFVIIAHDSTVRDGVDHFPKSLNHWRQQGWGEKLKWAFLRDLKTYWNNAPEH